MELWTVPRLWPGETVAVAATGPSLTARDVERLKGRVRVIAVNDAFRLAPWADCLYFADFRWFMAHKDEVMAFRGMKVTIINSKEVVEHDPSVKVVGNDNEKGFEGLCLRPDAVKTGRNSGYQGLNLSVHLAGPGKRLLTGFDMKRTVGGLNHYFGDHPRNVQTNPQDPAIYRQWVEAFRTTLPDLKRAGVEVINCTRDTALTCFPCVPLENVLNDRLQPVA